MSTHVVFFGSGAFGIPTLRRLAAPGVIRAVVTQPDRPAGRGGKPTPTPVAAWAAEHLPDIPILKPERVADPDVIRRVHELAGPSSDTCFVVIAFGQKMPRELLDDYFAINLHASLLPRWRGAAPINAAILAGDQVTGNSVITLADRMDAGEILGQASRPIPPLATASELHDQLAEDGPDLVQRVIAEWRVGRLHPITQDESQVTKARKLSRDDAWVDFAQSADEVRRRVHGLNPWPGVAVRFRGEDLKLLRVQSEPTSVDAPPGTVVDPARGVVACGRGSLQLLEVQPAGRKPMPWRDFANGRRVSQGEKLEGGMRA